MPKGKVERLIPKRFQTVSNMIKEGVKVRAHCSKCDLTLVVDLELLKSHNGETFSLIGKRGKCRFLTPSKLAVSTTRVRKPYYFHHADIHSRACA